MAVDLLLITLARDVPSLKCDRNTVQDDVGSFNHVAIGDLRQARCCCLFFE